MKRITYWLRTIVGFSQREIGGFAILTVIIVLAVIAPFLYGRLSAESLSEESADKRKLDSLRIVLRQSEAERATPEEKPVLASPEKIIIHAFNPNELSLAQWQEMGLQPMLAQRILNYRKKGGKFKTKADLLKIYSFPAEIYLRLEPYILLPDTIVYSKKQLAAVLPEKEKATVIAVKDNRIIGQFDLNQADSVQLMRIKGIGPGLSRRIINYRNKLGGFFHEGQLKEVYGLDSMVVNELLTYATVKNPVLQKIPVNKATVQELDAHPYISPKIATLIVDYRKQHGSYASLENLYQIRALDKALLDKLAPYLSFE